MEAYLEKFYQTDPDEGYPVLCWSGAVLRLKDRDVWIGRDPLTRGSRLPFVTQLRRFIVLESRREANLATRCIGLALHKLPVHFGDKYAENLISERPVDLVGELERGHGRFEIRDITLAAVDTELSPFPHIAQIIKCTRIYRSTKEGALPDI